LGQVFSGTITSGALAGQTFNFGHIPSYNYFDLAMRFSLNEHLDLTFTVQNLLNKLPPIVGSTIGSTTFNSGNTYPSTYDALGRRYAASARLRF
jgi:iron complex outermembrane receptor protein